MALGNCCPPRNNGERASSHGDEPPVDLGYCFLVASSALFAEDFASTAAFWLWLADCDAEFAALAALSAAAFASSVELGLGGGVTMVVEGAGTTVVEGVDAGGGLIVVCFSHPAATATAMRAIASTDLFI